MHVDTSQSLFYGFAFLSKKLCIAAHALSSASLGSDVQAAACSAACSHGLIHGCGARHVVMEKAGLVYSHVRKLACRCQLQTEPRMITGPPTGQKRGSTYQVNKGW